MTVNKVKGSYEDSSIEVSRKRPNGICLSIIKMFFTQIYASINYEM